jgi:hypothetical protein
MKGDIVVSSENQLQNILLGYEEDSDAGMPLPPPLPTQVRLGCEH